MRVRWLIDRCLGRKHRRSKIVGRRSVQVKAPDSNNGAPWVLQCTDALSIARCRLVMRRERRH
jgi:hypothetical protein